MIATEKANTGPPTSGVAEGWVLCGADPGTSISPSLAAIPEANGEVTSAATHPIKINGKRPESSLTICVAGREAIRAEVRIRGGSCRVLVPPDRVGVQRSY